MQKGLRCTAHLQYGGFQTLEELHSFQLISSKQLFTTAHAIVAQMALPANFCRVAI